MFFFFGLLTAVLAQNCWTQDCDCEIETRDGKTTRACDDLDCCEIQNDSATRRNLMSRSIEDEFGQSTSVATRCLCCSCLNVTCKNTIDATVSLDTEVILRSEESVDVSQKQKKTVADYHREIMEDRVEVRGCTEIQEICDCQLQESACTNMDCCAFDNVLPPFDVQDRSTSPMILRGTEGRGDILVDCDCCSCSNVKCDNEIGVDLTVAFDASPPPPPP